jgi:tripartite-type tricarboxylate transporter receptor subunit TctC
MARFLNVVAPLTRQLAKLVLLACLPLAASAQGYPTRPIKLIIPFPAGSVTDGAARFMANEMQKGLGQPIVIENQTGADGIIAVQNAKRAAPDGYTLFMGSSSTMSFNPAFYRELPYDADKDFEPVGGLYRVPMMLGVRKDFPADDLAGFIKIAAQRAATKPLSFGSGNVSNQLATELLKASTKMELIQVPYRGTPQALQDLVGGQIDAMFVDPLSSTAFVKGGQIKGLALTDSTRVPMLPNVPTMAESGHKEVEVSSFAGFFAPAKTDPAIIDRLSKEITNVLQKTQTKEFIQDAGATPLPMSPSELRGFVRSEISRWQKVVDAAGIPKK